MTMQNNQTLHHQTTEQPDLNKRLEDIGWGLFLILLGGLWLVPEELVPQGAWLIGAGLIMLGVNGARYANGIHMSGFTFVLGIVALAAGVGSFLGVELPLFALFLILLGASILVKPFFEKER